MAFVIPDAVREPLYCIVPVFNPWRWKSRWKHTERAIKHFIDLGMVVYLVEVAFGRREFAFANSGLDGSPANCPVIGSDPQFRHRYLGYRTTDELWLKENAINLAAAHLPHHWQNLCCLDGDIHFVRPNVVGETIHKLQHYAFLQMFSHARDLGPNYEVLPESYPHANGVSFVRAYQDGRLEPVTPRTKLPAGMKPGPANDQMPAYYDSAPRVFPGLAWAATREAWDAVGGLIDVAVWGGGDWHMAHALIEKTEGMMRKDLHRNYKKIINQWYERCRTHIRSNVGMVDGTVLHHWHGRKTDRGYNAKHALLAKIGFDPPRHLKRDFQGLWQLHDDRSPAYVQLRDMMRRIAAERDEDSTDTRLDLLDESFSGSGVGRRKPAR